MVKVLTALTVQPHGVMITHTMAMDLRQNRHNNDNQEQNKCHQIETMCGTGYLKAPQIINRSPQNEFELISYSDPKRETFLHTTET